MTASSLVLFCLRSSSMSPSLVPPHTTGQRLPCRSSIASTQAAHPPDTAVVIQRRFSTPRVSVQLPLHPAARAPDRPCGPGRGCASGARPSATRCRRALSGACPIPAGGRGEGSPSILARGASGGWWMRRRVARIHRRRRAARRRRALRLPPHMHTRGCNGLVGTRASVCIRTGGSTGQAAVLAQQLMSSFAVGASTSSIVASLGSTPAPSSVRRRPSLIRNAPVFAVPATLVGMDAVERLKVGFQKFKTEVYDKKPELFEPLKGGQAPKYMVFACADSRVCPSVTLGLQPGEAFTVRNIAAMVPPYDKTKYSGTGSAIEYAVCALKVEVLVVIGHSCCGGIRALLSLKDSAPDNFHFVEDWVRIGSPAKTKVQKEHASVPFDDQCSILEKEAVNVSLANLKTYPFVKERLAKGTLKLVGGHYDFVSGKFVTWEPVTDAVERLKSGFEQFKIEVYDKKPDLFEPLKSGQAPRYMVFACADSRVCPSVTLGLLPGEAFTVRNIAAMVPGYDKTKYTGIGSAIEYAVCALKVQVLVVIGHSCCGGIRALLSLQDGAPDNFHFVEDWVKIGFPAKMKVKKEHASVPFDDQCYILEKEAVNVSLENLKTYPFVKEGLAKGTLKLVGGHYDFVRGEFLTWKV